MIPYGRQDVTQADIDAVVAVLRSDFLTQGPAVPAFEQALARRCGSAHGVAMSNATAALHVACLALGVGPGDRVWTSAVTFVASANCARYCGADVGFVDVDPRTGNMSVADLGDRLEAAERNGALPKVVIPVHLTGQSCDMRAIHELSRRYGFRIIEDASHAVGASYLGEPVGCCRYSDVAVFSFHPVKIITTGEGGMAMTNDDALAMRMVLLRSHGITRDPADMAQVPPGAWYYEQVALGFNYRMTDLQAALGLSQSQRLDAYVARRHEIADRYDARLRSLPVDTPWRDPDGRSALHLYVVRLRKPSDHARAFAAMRARGIGVNLHYIPVPAQPYYRDLGFDPAEYPQAQAYYSSAMSLPIFPALDDARQDEVVDALAASLDT